jgi:hypothetical protein
VAGAKRSRGLAAFAPSHDLTAHVARFLNSGVKRCVRLSLSAPQVAIRSSA